MDEVEEKPGGARNVVSWGLNVMRSFHPVYVLTGNRIGYDSPDPVTVHISVTFEDNESAIEFEEKVRAMLPEVKR